MFLGDDRLPVVREMILADTPDEEAAALEELRPRAADRLRGDPRGDGRAAGHGAPARPAAARVPAVGRGAARSRRPPTGLSTREEQASSKAAEELGRAQPDARHPRRAPRRGQAGPLRDAGAGAHGGGRRAAQEGQEPDRRGHDPAHRHPRGAARWPAAGCEAAIDERDRRA